MLGLKPVQVNLPLSMNSNYYSQTHFLERSFASISIPVTEDSVGYYLRLYVSMYARAFRVTLK